MGGAAGSLVDGAAWRARRNPVALAGTLIGALGAALGAATAARVLDDGRRRRHRRGRRRGTRLAGGVLAATALGGMLGRVAQRWTWSDDRVGDELLDAELALWEA